MPLSALAQVIIEVFGQMVVESAVAVGSAVVADVREKRAMEVQLARTRALALVDLLVIAASHDHVVTEAERGELANRLPALLESTSTEVRLEPLLQRWADTLRAVANEEDLIKLIADTASIISVSKRREAFDAVCALLHADAIAARPTAGPFREAGSRSKADSARIFGRALGIDDDAIADAARRLA